MADEDVPPAVEPELEPVPVLKDLPEPELEPEPVPVAPVVVMDLVEGLAARDPAAAQAALDAGGVLAIARQLEALKEASPDDPVVLRLQEARRLMDEQGIKAR